MNNKKVIFTDGSFELTVLTGDENNIVWLTQKQISELFERDVKTINRHINDIYKENELSKSSTISNFEIVQIEGGRKITRNINHYNLDVILSVGYRVKSSRGSKFRIWSNSVLKDYLLNGVAYNTKQLEKHKKVLKLIPILERSKDEIDGTEVLEVIQHYAKALRLLDDYDYKRIVKPDGTTHSYVLTYKEARKIIDKMNFSESSKLFGREKDELFKSAINNIYQTYDSKEIYPTLEEKAANLLYLITKNHSFIDGNKRIAATIFLYFLDRNNKLFNEYGEKTIHDGTLVAITIMIAESKAEEKELMIDLIMNFL